MFGWVGGVFSKSVLGFEEVVLRMGRRLLMEEEEKLPKKPLSPLLLFCFMVLAIEGIEREREESSDSNAGWRGKTKKKSVCYCFAVG